MPTRPTAIPFAGFDPATRQAGVLAAAWLYQATDDADPWTAPAALSLPLARSLNAAHRGIVPVRTTVDLARLAIADWALAHNEALATGKDSASEAVQALSIEVAVQFGTAHLLRDRHDARSEYAPRSAATANLVIDASLMMAALGEDTAIARQLHVIAGTDADTAAGRTAAALAADQAKGLVMPSDFTGHAEFRRAAEATLHDAREAVFQHARHAELEKALWREMEYDGDTTRDDILRQIVGMSTSRSAPESWEQKSVGLAIQYLAARMGEKEWRPEAPRLAIAAARHFDAVRAGEEPAVSSVDSARMILADWAVQVNHAHADSYPWFAGPVLWTSRSIVDALELEPWTARAGAAPHDAAAQLLARDAARSLTPFDMASPLDEELHRRNRTLVEGDVALRTRAAVNADRRQGFAICAPGNTQPIDWRASTDWNEKASATLHRAEKALAAGPPPARPPLLYRDEDSRSDLKAVAAIEATLAWPGERVALVKPNVPGGPYWGAEHGIVRQTLVDRWEDGCLAAIYAFVGSGGYHHAQAYGIVGEDPAAARHRRGQAAVSRRAMAAAQRALARSWGR